jgi:integrase/recombinase XerD
MECLAPVEYAVAVDLYLDQSPLSRASRRVYQISLAGWAWPLVGRPVPPGRQRRGAGAPLVPLALLNDPGTARRLSAAFAERTAAAGPRTANRELSALRSATGWWREQGWISADPAAGLRHRQPGALRPPLTQDQVGVLFQLPASLREQALWHVLHDSGVAAAEVLALDADRLDLDRHQTRPGVPVVAWSAETSRLLRWLLAGRTWGPAFVTSPRAPVRDNQADVCRVTGQARMSYRRAAELFTAATQPLDTTGRGWTLHQLSSAQHVRAGGRRLFPRAGSVSPGWAMTRKTR